MVKPGDMASVLDFSIVLAVLMAYYYKPNFVYQMGSSVIGRIVLVLAVVLASEGLV